MKHFLTVFALFLFVKLVKAQTVGINSTGAVPATSAMLDVSSNNKGVLISRVDIVDLNTAVPVSAPVISLLVYNTNVSSGVGYYFWDGLKWVKLSDSNSNADEDWHEVGGSLAPNSINDDIFTEGNVGIGIVAPSEKLTVVSADGIPTVHLGGGDGLDIYQRIVDDVVGLQSTTNLGADGGSISLQPNIGNVGIGTVAPSEKLEVQGSVKVVDGTEGLGKVLTSDATGKASWQNVSLASRLTMNVSKIITIPTTGAYLISAGGDDSYTGSYYLNSWTGTSTGGAFNGVAVQVVGSGQYVLANAHTVSGYGVSVSGVVYLTAGTQLVLNSLSWMSGVPPLWYFDVQPL